MSQSYENIIESFIQDNRLLNLEFHTGEYIALLVDEWRKRYTNIYMVELGATIETFRVRLSVKPIVLSVSDLHKKSIKLFLKDNGFKSLNMNLDVQKEKMDEYLQVIVSMGSEKRVENWSWKIIENVEKAIRGLPVTVQSNNTNADKGVFVKNSKAFKLWQNYIPTPLSIPESIYVRDGEKPSYPKRNGGIYANQNDGRDFISIDIKAANFQALRHVSPDIVSGCTTWEEFLGRIINIPYFSGCKRLRMMALSNKSLLPAKQKLVWESMILDLFYNLIEAKIISETDLASWQSDEIVLHFNGLDQLEAIEKFIKEKYIKWESFLRVEPFRLQKVHPLKSYFAKIVTDKVTRKEKVVFKCVDQEKMNECVCLYNSLQ